jgi:hypothetical protein
VARAIASEIRDGVATDGLVRHGRETIWAYEVDGLGGRILMDDANAPGLLSLPYFGACMEADPVYLATRRWVLSPENPWWFRLDRRGRWFAAHGLPPRWPTVAMLSTDGRDRAPDSDSAPLRATRARSSRTSRSTWTIHAVHAARPPGPTPSSASFGARRPRLAGLSADPRATPSASRPASTCRSAWRTARRGRTPTTRTG